MTTSCSSCPTRPASATSGTLAKPVARVSNWARTASVGRVTIGAGYTFLSATYESEETVNGESNSTNDAAEDGEPGLEGSIEIVPGDRIPLIPRHMFKAYADIPLGSRLSVDVDLLAVSEFVCPRQREQPARAGRHVLPRLRVPCPDTRS